MEPGDLFVGNSLWWVSNYNAKTQEAVTVTKVGRKWATLSNRHRINVDTMAVDGGEYVPPGRCYSSRAAYEQEAMASAAWDALRRDIQDAKRPDHVTMDKIFLARALLFGAEGHL